MSKVENLTSYILDDDNDTEEITAANIGDAREQAVNWMKETTYSEEGNQYLECSIRTADGEYIETVSHMIPGVEPECTKAEKHQWTATWEKQGGLKENPGTFSEGAVTTTERFCKHCNIVKSERYDGNTQRETRWYDRDDQDE